MLKPSKLIFIVTLIFTQNAIGQLHGSILANDKIDIKNGSFGNRAAWHCIFSSTKQPVKPMSSGQLIKTMLIKDLGFFCKNELTLDKISPISLRFRLGSLDYVNWMEQKPNAIKPGR